MMLHLLLDFWPQVAPAARICLCYTSQIIILKAYQNVNKNFSFFVFFFRLIRKDAAADKLADHRVARHVARLQRRKRAHHIHQQRKPVRLHKIIRQL